MTQTDFVERADQGQTRLRVQNAVLRIAARHDNLLSRPVFDELSAVVARFAGVGAMGLIVRDGATHVRIYAASKEGPDFAPTGARIPQTPHMIQTVHVEGRVLVCDDTRNASEAERMLASAGFLSYVELPVRAAGSSAVLAGLMFAFRVTHGAEKAPMEILSDVAEIIGANMARAMDAARDRRLAMILETSGDAMVSWDKDGRITDVNAAAVALAGRSREHLLGTSIRSFLLVSEVKGRKRGGPDGERMVLLTAHGPCIVAATITAVDDDPLVASHALLRDISALVSSEDAAAQHLAHIGRLEEQHRAVLDNAPLIIFRLDPVTLELVYLNGHAERLLGVPNQEAMSTRAFLRAAHADPHSVTDFETAVQQARAGHGATPYEARLRRRLGDDITAKGSIYPMLDRNGRVVAIEGVLADVSSEHAARSRLVQADRLSTLGMLAAGVAHEINNPAAFVLLGIDMLDRLLQSASKDLAEGPRSQAATLIGELRDSVRRIVDIARDLRLFSSVPGEQRTFVDVNRSVESALTLTRGHLIERAHIHRDLGSVPNVLMEDNRLGQVLVNLLVNAAQAIPKPGTPTSGRGSKDPTSPKHTISVATRLEGTDVIIQVSDTGVGIPKENKDRIFNPFFTTKPSDVGTGLGLSICKDIIDRAGGKLTVESPVPETGRGTRFTIRLPFADPALTNAVVRPSPPPSARTVDRGRVLLVEDEAVLARALAEGIGRVHEVRVVDGAQRALDLLLAPPASRDTLPAPPLHDALPTSATRDTMPAPISRDSYPAPTTLVSGQLAPAKPEEFDVVLCDLRMPGMSGEALYNELKAQREDLTRKFIFMTGVGFGADVERFLKDAGRPVLEKPFGTEAALQQIARVMARQKRT